MADAAHPALILETRKTAPGLRLVDKWAVQTHSLTEIYLLFMFFLFLCLILLTFSRNLQFQVLIGGGRNHRMGLFDMVLINISIARGVTNALKSVDSYLEKRNLRMEVEVKLLNS